MDALGLARLQFATTTSFHFLFVLLTLGLVTVVAVTQTRATLSADPVHARMTRFWGRLYVVNYALGIATGIVMEFQFGLNWSGLSTFAGDVFGAPLAMETLVAFFLESTFLGLWIFGWDRLNKWAHLALIWLVALTAFASAFWIMMANAFLQNPVGHELRDGVLRMVDFSALLANPTFVTAFLHVCFAALTVGGVFVTGVSAYHFIRRTTEVDFFRRSLRLGVVLTALATPMLIGFGFGQFPVVQEHQPEKLDTVGALDGIGLGFMIQIGFVLLLVSWATVPLLFRDWVVRLRFPLYLMVLGIPLPFVAAIGGWLFREIGRQPWLVQGLLTTADAVSHVSRDQMLVSFVAFTAVFAVLAVADWVLIARLVRRGPVFSDEAPVSPLVPAL
ncbi:cytochrome d ubiquinol oxidase subunit I [Saccharothrix ecbatanensis]|jgi:cytochrome d ubiquinol oxidase subunit I|uniref:Cytochrome d ubiquinol oxidase subunit I n=1 Tax=Saccharothrix ecbatanensis TaxID=1105145 RepID=A0A7W9HSK8_9PSEU|nr:cytochrome ubiquinol oxidase subunit I [Saccharothrix ecbatanensis]MBB5807712.1 cytochrome d ubiquinol oxidase subunit I [Saccharothrix ecbatanensis]